MLYLYRSKVKYGDFMKKRKKNKKKEMSGFTLIELLAVIVILGLLIGIAYPSVSKYINDTRNTTYSLHEAEMQSSAANMMSQCIERDTPNCVPENGHSKTIYLRELIDTKYSQVIRDPAKNDAYCNETQSYVVVTNSSGNVAELDYQVCLVCSAYKSDYCSEVIPGSKCDIENDKTPPTCGAVVGGSMVWTNKDRVVSVECSDSNCGCAQSTYYKRFTESAKKGKVTISDTAGNTKDCDVNVYVDKELPTCQLEVIGDLGDNDWYGGNSLKVKLKSKSDTLSGVSTYGMGTSKKNYNFDKSEVFEVSPGISTVYGYVKDNAGNVGVCSVELKYDNIKPTQDVTLGYQVYPKSDMASVNGGTINIGNFLSEYGKILGINIYLNSNSSGMSTVIKSGSTTLSSRTISAGVLSMQYMFTASTYSSLSINMGSSANVSKVKRIEVIVDHTTGFYTNQDVTVYVSSHDSLSGKAEYSFDGGSSWGTTTSRTYSSNNSNIKVITKDRSGNKSDTKNINISNIDKTSPTCSINPSGTTGSNSWYTGNVSLTLASSDGGVSTMRNRGLTTSSAVTYNNVTSGTQSLDTSSTTWYGYVRDKAGNTGTCSVTIKKDATKPTCSVNPSGTTGSNGWYTGNVSLSLSTNDATSKVSSYDLTESSSATYNKNTSKTLSTDTTSKTYYGYVKDSAGNVGTCSVTVKRDATKPTCSVNSSGSTGSNGWYTGNVSLSLSTNDATSKVSSYDLTESSSATYNKNTSKTLSNDTTSKTYYGYVKDNAGNVGNCSKTVKRDTVRPSCSINISSGSLGSNSWYKSNVGISLSSKSDGTSGVTGYGIGTSTTANYNSSTSATHSSDTKGITYYGYVKDDAGWTNTCSVSFKRDVTAPDKPKITNPTNDNWTDKDFSLTVESNDAISGIDYWYYSYNNSSWTKYDNSSYNSYGKTSFVTSPFSAERNNTVYIRVCDKAGNCNTNTTSIRIDKCVSPTLSYGSYGACSANCGGGTQTRTVSKKGISGKSCGSYTQSRSCNTQACPQTNLSYCPSDESLFGDAQTRTPRLPAGSRPSNYGEWHSSLGSYTCYAGGTCNRTCGYDRVCIGSACGTWYGHTATEINNAYGCGYAKWWCQCDAGYC